MLYFLINLLFDACKYLLKKSIRKKAQYTQEDFSEKLGITTQLLSSVERGINGIIEISSNKLLKK